MPRIGAYAESKLVIASYMGAKEEGTGMGIDWIQGYFLG